MFITFMVDAINRFLEHPEDKIVGHIVEAFGGDEAIRIAKGGGNRILQLRELYQAKLRSVAKYVRFFEMRDDQDRVQYYLFFASNNSLGHLKMKEAMWRADPAGKFRFSDATNPDQMVLFEDDPTKVLASQLRDRFQGKGTISAGEVRKFVEDETAYLKKHMNAVLKEAEQAGRIKVDAIKADGKKRRKETFPDEVRLTWV